MTPALWLALSLAACDGSGTADTSTADPGRGPAWTQIALDCAAAGHAWTGWANGLYGHAELRLVPATADPENEAHPLSVQDADPGGSWTLFALDLQPDVDDAGATPGRISALDCRDEGVHWTWALDLLLDGVPVACTQGEVLDSGGVPEQVATCDVPK